MSNFEGQKFRDDLAENLKTTSGERRRALLEKVKQIPEYWRARNEKIRERGETKIQGDGPEQIGGFEEIEGYTLETFSSEEEMHSRMESIRQSNTNEAHGFVVKKSSTFGFYYQVGDSQISVEFPPHIDNSWHSHPDSNISEVAFNEEDLPDEAPEYIKEIARRVVMNYGNIDQVSPKKISLMDIINVLGHARMEDLISMPDGHLLSLKYQNSQDDALCRNFASRIDEYWKNLVAEVRSKLTEENMDELRLSMILHYYDYAISEFKNMLGALGYEKMTTDNFIEILNKIGLSNNIHKV